MLRTTLRSLWSHKLRLLLTMVSIVLGMAFMAGTLVLNSTVGRVFDDLFADLGENVDAVVRGKELFQSQQTGVQRDLVDETVVAKVEAVPGVAAAEGDIGTTDIAVIDSKGDPMGGFGPPTIVGSWTSDSRMASYQVAEGRAPTKAGEAIIDRGGAKKADFSVGDRIQIVGIDGKRDQLDLVGISKFGEADSAGGSIFVGVTLPEAQRLAGEPGKLSTINVLAEDGVTPEQLVENLRAADLAPGVDVVTGKAASAEQASDVKQGLGFFTTALLIFAFVAIFVAAFIISNTFSILISQRTRELALLRAIGASRRQVLTSTLTEAVLIGVVASVIGFLAGIALAFGALALLDTFGVDLPDTSLLVEPITGVQVLATGLVVTIASAILPAVRATRVPPIAALRSTATEPRGTGKVRVGLGVAMAALGALMIRPAFASRPANDDLPGIGIGMGLVVLAVIVLGPFFARPLTRLVGSWLPLVKGVVGRMARENAMRSPRRTASTAAALIIGVALVVFITVFASSARATVDAAFGTNFNADYIVSPLNQASAVGSPPAMAERLADVPGVATVDPSGGVIGQIVLPNGDETGGFLTAVNPATYVDVWGIAMAEGSLADLVPGTIVVDAAIAREHGIEVGQQVSIIGTGGRRATFRVSALSDDALVTQWTINRADSTKLAPAATDYLVAIQLEPGVSIDDVRGDLRAVVDQYPNMRLQDKEQFRSSIVAVITALLNVILGLLAVSIVIAFIGILNTMLLAIHERTRELGLLRAVGMTRSQMRSAVRWEAVVVSLIGAGLGVALGLGLSYTMVRALASRGIDQFAVPVMWMVVVAVLAVVFGIIAAAWPAHKASKLNILDSIATE